MPKRHYLAACLFFKNAASYLEEWLAFYSVLGVEHFYLYDNDSTDDYPAVIQAFVRDGTATLESFPGRARQQEAYEHCLKKHGSHARWMLFCDDDEFLYPCVDVSLPTALEPYEKYAGVAVSWMLFGSSGHVTRPPGFVIANYTRRFAVPDQHVKCVVDPSRIQGCMLIAHEFRPKTGEVIVDETGEPMAGPFRISPSADVFRINHYLTKSKEELIYRRSHIQADTGEVSLLSIQQWLDLEAGWNQLLDTSAYRYIERIEARLSS